MIRRIVRTFLPPLAKHQRVARAPRRYSSPDGRVTADPESVQLLQLANLASTPADAARLLARYPTLSATEIIRRSARYQRRNLLVTFVRRFRYWWGG